MNHDSRPARRDVLRLAAAADVDPRTAAKALSGKAVRGITGERIAAALAALNRRPMKGASR